MVHDLGDDGHIELVCRLAQQVETFGTHTLVCVRGGAGLVCASAQHGGAGGLYASSDLDEVLAFDRAGAGDYLEVAAADLDAVAAVDNGVLGMELAVGLLEGFGDALDTLDDIHGL